MPRGLMPNGFRIRPYRDADLPDLLASGQLFFTLMGAIIFFVWASSNYGDKRFAALA